MNKNTIQKLLYIFSPSIKFKGQSIVCSNHNDLPCDFLLLKELYYYFDLGLIHSSKCFHIEQLPNELSKYIIEYLNKNEVSLKKVKNFYMESYYRLLFFKERDAYIQYLQVETKKQELYANIRFTALETLTKKIERLFS